MITRDGGLKVKEYIQNNKAAWEESFAMSKIGFGLNDAKILQNEVFPFIYSDLLEVINQYDLKGKYIAQMCCNNGREIMSIVKGTGAKKGLGFDIAENIIEQARDNAKISEIPCEFVLTNILDIDEKYYEQFDAVFVLIGAICWFEDLGEFFSKVGKCLKKGGLLFVHEIHPCTNMLAVPGEEIYDAENKTKIAWSYFKEEPFVDDWGMGYMVGEAYKSKPFTNFTYKMSDIINGIVDGGMKITMLKEFDYDIGGEFKELEGKGFPLSYILTAKK